MTDERRIAEGLGASKVRRISDGRWLTPDDCRDCGHDRSAHNRRGDCRLSFCTCVEYVPRPADEMTDLNAALHRLLGVDDPCEHACTHVITGEWTALGLANVAARAVARAEGGDE